MRRSRERLVATIASCSLASACTLFATVPDLSSGTPAAANDAAGEGGVDAAEAAIEDGGGGDAAAADTAGEAGVADTYASVIMADAPRVYYRFDETSGTTAVDMAKQFPGKYRGGATLGVPGIFAGNSAVSLDGASGGVDSGDVDFVGKEPFSVEVWLSPRTIGSINGTVFFKDGVSGGRQAFGAYVRSPQGVVFERWVAGAEIATQTPLAVNQFSYLVCVFDGAALRIYVDGALAANIADNRDQAKKASSFLIGYDVAAGGQSFFDGVLDELAVYSRALDEADILRHYHAAGR